MHWILLLFIHAPQPLVHQVEFADEVACRSAAVEIHKDVGVDAVCVAFSSEVAK